MLHPFKFVKSVLQYFNRSKQINLNTKLDIHFNSKWRKFDEGKTVGKKGSENGIIIFDIEHIDGARITLEQKTRIAPYATTLGVYGLMFHTHFDKEEKDANIFISQAITIIDVLLSMYDIAEEERDMAWNEKSNSLIEELTEN